MSAVRKGDVTAVQFHPEKSGGEGRGKREGEREGGREGHGNVLPVDA